MLMPSLPPLAPKPAMTRPRAGQRKSPDDAGGLLGLRRGRLGGLRLRSRRGEQPAAAQRRLHAARAGSSARPDLGLLDDTASAADTRGFGGGHQRLVRGGGDLRRRATCAGAGAWAVEVMPGRTRLAGSAAATGVVAAGTLEVSTRRNLGWAGAGLEPSEPTGTGAAAGSGAGAEAMRVGCDRGWDCTGGRACAWTEGVGIGAAA